MSSDDILIMMNGGVAGTIRMAGGSQIIQDVQKFKLPLVPSEIAMTGAGRLNAKYVFHAAILHPKQQKQNFDQLVEESVKKCLERMKIMSCQSISFPLLASGTAGFGPKESARRIFSTIKNFLDSEPTTSVNISICVYGELTLRNNDLESLFNSYFI